LPIVLERQGAPWVENGRTRLLTEAAVNEPDDYLSVLLNTWRAILLWLTARPTFNDPDTG
jgi:hypothetical protein